jgi:type II secretory pathway component PulF
MTDWKPIPLSVPETEALLGSVADATAAGLPLAAGLRAAADEASSRRLAGELRRLAWQLDAGRSLDDVLLTPPGRFSDYVGGLVRAGVRSGRLGEVLVELVDQQRRLREMWRSIRSALAYPTVLLVLAVGFCVFADLTVVSTFLNMFAEFKLKLPRATQVLVWWHRSGMSLLGAAGVLLIGVAVFRLVAGPARWRRSVATVPLFGALTHWSGVAELTRLLAILADQQVPLPEALQLAAAGCRDANLREVSRWLAQGAAQGRSLADLLASTRRLPASLRPILSWGERSGQLAEAFQLASEMFEGRVRLRADLVRSLLPFGIFLTVGNLLLFMLVALYLPMLGLVQGLA